MKERFLTLLGLDETADLVDIKSAYRALAKKNHPDRFTDEKAKARQAKVMAALNEAYKYLLEHHKAKKREPLKERDTTLYKKGVGYFSEYSGSISLKFPQYTRFDKESVEAKRESLVKAKECFECLLEEFPESDWAYDAQERLKKIEKILVNLKGSSGLKDGGLPKKESEFYYNKFKKTFER